MRESNKFLKKYFSLAAGCSLLAIAWAAPHYPAHQGYVTDSANVLDSAGRQSLERQLSDFERESAIELAVAIVPSLEGETIDGYAVGLFKQWGIGKKSQDNGVLLLVAPGERKVRIEVGYGLEARLPDGLSGEIIRTSMIPGFKSGHPSEAIAQGVAAIIAALHGQMPENPEAPDGNMIAKLIIFLILGFLILMGYIDRKNRLHGRVRGGLWTTGTYPNDWTGGGFSGGSGGGGSFGGFGGGSSGGGGASGSW